MIKWITDELGTASYYDYEKVCNTTDAFVVVDVRELTDKEGNTSNLILTKIQVALKMLQEKRNVVICCDKGLSRSNAIALGVLMASGMSYEKALGLLVSKVDPSNINLGLLHDVRFLFDTRQRQAQIPPKNILITGSTGFVGRALVNALGPEFKLFCPHRDQLDLAGGLSLLDLYINKHDVDFIIHLAHPRNRNSSSAMAEAVAMMRNILEVCRLNQRGVLYLSGLVVFSGYITDYVLNTRSSLELWPKGVYAETKFLCEELIRIYQKTYNLEAIVLRPSALYGTGMDRTTFISKFFKAALQGVNILTHRYRNGLPVFDFLHLDDLVYAIRLALQVRPRMALNIGTGKSVSTYNLAQSIVRICNSPSVVETIDIDDNISKIVVEPSEAATQLGWAARIDLDEGLRRLWYYYSNKEGAERNDG